MIETLKSGGILIIPIIICGILATFIIIERCIYFASIKKRDEKLMQNVNSSLAVGDYESCSSACVEADTPMSQVIKKAIDCRRYEERDIRDLVEAEMDFVVPRFEHFITPLGTIANISTLLGLLGTVTGNIKAFGLSVSIPSVIFHNYFVSRVNRRIVEMEAHVTSVVLKLTGRVK